LVLQAADPRGFGPQHVLLVLDIDPVLALHALLPEQFLAGVQEVELLLQRREPPVEEFDDDAGRQVVGLGDGQGKDGYSLAGVASMSCSRAVSASRPAAEIMYVVRSGRLPSRSVPVAATRPCSSSRPTA
jgi:hypothetical protein